MPEGQIKKQREKQQEKSTEPGRNNMKVGPE
jgi:hypothetical protein